jgi:hypothetical protein
VSEEEENEDQEETSDLLVMTVLVRHRGIQLLDHIRCESIAKRVSGEIPVGFLLNQKRNK